MELKEFLLNDRFAASNGCEIAELALGRAVIKMRVEARHLNAGNVCQGGAIFTLCDLACAAALNSHGPLTLSLNGSITFHRSALEGDLLTAEAIEIVNHHKVPYCEAHVLNQDGALIASFQTQAYRK